MGSIPDSFYVTLSSNSSMKAHAANMISSFTVQLAHEIDLAGDSWKVALCEFSCPLPKVGSQKPHAVFYEKNALICCELIAPQFVNHSKFRCLRTFIPLRPSAMKSYNSQPSVTRSLETCIRTGRKSIIAGHYCNDNRHCREPDCLPR